MTREEAIKMIQDDMRLHHDYLSGEYRKALRMAIEALTKPNYETDTEVRLAVADRKKEKVILWDAFGEVEYYPHTSHGRLIDADALSKKLCETTIFIKEGKVFQSMINDAPTVQADRPHGEWEVCEDGDGIYGVCSICGCDADFSHYGVPFDFCPNCGADMRGGGDE